MNIKGSIEISLLDIQKSLEILSSDISLSHVEAYQKKTLEALGRIHKILSEKIPLNTNEHL